MKEKGSVFRRTTDKNCHRKSAYAETDRGQDIAKLPPTDGKTVQSILAQIHEANGGSNPSGKSGRRYGKH